MITAVWSLKGGAGVTTVAGLLALSQVESGNDAVMVDLVGGSDAVLGLELDVGQPGVAEWMAIERSDADALARLEVPVRAGLTLLPAGRAAPAGDPSRLVQVLRTSRRQIVVDCGLVRRGYEPARSIVEQADVSLLVVRECFVTLRTAREFDLRPDGVVVIRERGRALGLGDVEAVTGAPVVATIRWDRSVFQAVDAGLGHARIPRGLLRSLSRMDRHVA